ncbi:hypothetical protein LY76DRAFT_595474 [Colletotrichum caudatum]|nr:hypothetical protein LY76DRAFT_595474 [Colletotrichum caudatum]
MYDGTSAGPHYVSICVYLGRQTSVSADEGACRIAILCAWRLNLTPLYLVLLGLWASSPYTHAVLIVYTVPKQAMAMQRAVRNWRSRVAGGSRSDSGLGQSTC